MIRKMTILMILKEFAKHEFGVLVPSDWDKIESMVLSADEMEDFSTNEEVLKDGGIVYTYMADEPRGYDCSININIVTTNDGVPVDVSMDTEDGETKLDFDASQYIPEDISSIQGQLARAYRRKLRQEAPWILGSED